ncbi:phosphate transport system ATP-binding protein [Gillisia mitskevichiae]|uniref:Phosphate transport system ATP-binding protein n=1 Tax=Gillisia mitskevichiae TaxID=270921 RepID=A0A495NZ44_9FLAO|nr:phosphate ABC transporter ATP-binding protein [Gillisia mitskevichiae]RKS42830.1 phosphate transport system ATP-binding protein [Gillisia mitskevichiae]
MAEKALKPMLSVVEKTQDKIIQIKDLQIWINESRILNNITLSIPKNEITCIIGPSGSGKSTLIRSINRINDEVPGISTQGEIIFNGLSINNKNIDLAQLRTQIGMVFQKPCVFPKSIKENVLFGIPHLKKISKLEKFQIAEENLKAVSLWKEVAHRLHDKAISLSLGQQQRLCIARTLAIKPEVILLDEPTSSLDPISARAIEDMMVRLKKKYTIIFVTHNLQQAKRIADNLVFICDGKLIEQGPASKMLSCPSNPETKAYVTDEYCEC